MLETNPSVLFLCPQPFFEWRGSPIRVGYNVQALAELGADVDLLVMPVGADRSIPSVRIHRVPNVIRAKRLPVGPSLAKAVLDLFLFWRAWRMTRRKRYSVIHGVEEAGALAVLLARRSGSRCIYEKHSDPASYRRGFVRNAIMALYARLETWTLRRADAVIVTGPGLAEQVRRGGPRRPPVDIFDIPSSQEEPDPARAREVRRQFLAESNGPLVMYVGSFAVYQGVDLMFQSFPDVIRAVPGIRMVVIGGSPPDIARRRQWLAEQGVADAVSFPGHIPPDELPHVLAAADILLSPRISGTNTPLKILDYFKAGAAVVACDTPANRLLLDSQTAELTAADPGAFAHGIIRLARDPERRARLAKEGLRRARETYTYTAFKEKLNRCYNTVLTGREEAQGPKGNEA